MLSVQLTDICPSCKLMILFTKYKPIPEPLFFVEKKGKKILLNSFFFIPEPLSSILINM